MDLWPDGRVDEDGEGRRRRRSKRVTFSDSSGGFSQGKYVARFEDRHPFEWVKNRTRAG